MNIVYVYIYSLFAGVLEMGDPQGLGFQYKNGLILDDLGPWGWPLLKTTSKPGQVLKKKTCETLFEMPLGPQINVSFLKLLFGPVFPQPICSLDKASNE